MKKCFYGLVLTAGLITSLVPVWAGAAGEVHALHPTRGFEANLGQTDQRVRFVSRGAGFDAFLTGDGVVLNPGDRRVTPAAWRFRGGDAAARCEGLERLPGISNYFIGRDPRRWVTRVPHYARVRCRDVLPGVDAVYYWRGGELEYDLEIRSGVDPAGVRLEFAGKARPRVEANGDLVFEAGGGRTRFRKPVVEQSDAEGRNRIWASYVVEGDGSVGFRVSGYDRSRKLVIDPVVVFSTYVGGPADNRPWTWLSGTQAAGMAVDELGNVYVTGETTSLEFPTTPWSPQPDIPALPDFIPKVSVVVKLSADGSKLLFSTYFGGTEGYVGIGGIAVDGLGRVHLAGGTSSSDFPVTPDALQPVKRGEPTSSDGFVTLLDSAGSRLLYSTYLGGSEDDGLGGPVFGPSGDLYIIGGTKSPDFPVTPGALQTSYAGGDNLIGGDAVVVRLSPRGDQIRYSTYMGGPGGEGAGGLAVDAQGNAYVAGETSDSANFPTTDGAIHDVVSPPSSFSDAFVFKLNAAGTGLEYSGVFGGRGDDSVSAISVDAAGAAYVVGTTTSYVFPTTPGAFQPESGNGGPPKGCLPNACTAVFAGKMTPLGDRLEYSTFLGGRDTYGEDIAVDAQGKAWVVGGNGRWAGLFPLRNPLQDNDTGSDALLAVLNKDGSDLVFSTLIGGSDDDRATAIALGPDRTVYVAGTSSFIAGSTFAGDFPTTPGTLQPSVPEAKWNMFIMRINPMETPRLDGSGIRNAASFRPGPVAPGELLSLFGLGVGSLNAIGAAPGDEGFFPTELRDTHVFFDGDEAPLLYTSAGQVNVIAPFALEGKTVTRVQVEFADARGNVLEIPVAPHRPALFTADASGEGQAAALNEDGAANGPAAPAAPGSVIVLFMAGGGQTVPAGIDGKVAEMNPPAPASPVEVTIGGVAAAIEYAGQAPGLVHGVWQINARIPPGVAGDAVPVTAKVGDSSSPPGVTVAVR